MSKRDFYEILACQGRVRRGHQEGVSQAGDEVPPDRNKGRKDAEARFKEAKEAYEMLSDKDKRVAYDRFGHAGRRSVDGWRRRGAGAGGYDFNEMFASLEVGRHPAAAPKDFTSKQSGRSV